MALTLASAAIRYSGIVAIYIINLIFLDSNVIVCQSQSEISRGRFGLDHSAASSYFIHLIIMHLIVYLDIDKIRFAKNILLPFYKKLI